MKYTFKTEINANSDWDNNLLKSTYASFFQSTNYLNSNSNDYFPIFIYIFDEEGNVVGQLGLRIIKTAVRYSSPFFRRLLHIISRITSRGIWLDGPIIFTDKKEARIEILQKIVEAIDYVGEKYNLVHIEGYTAGYDLEIDENYKNNLLKNNFIIEDYVTFILDMTKDIDEIWSNLSKRLKQDINRAKRRNIVVKELKKYDELEQYLLLAQKWAETKGIVNSIPIEDLEKFWLEHERKLSKFFLAYEDDELISGLRVVLFNRIVQPSEVISSYSKRTSLGGTLLTWASIEWAKSVNALIYDFTGGKKQLDQNDDGQKENKNSLVYYKSKWEGQEMPQYNLVRVRKKLNYKIYLFLFSIVRKYHDLRRK